MTLVSIYSVLDEIQQNRCKIMDVKGSIERLFYFIQRQGEAASLPELFIRFAKS
ncbi:MAG TPA: hypothetical protein VEV16_07430 [Daejeonella sp.]|nr:hypothetical protein [Daejeonella sp.]